MPGLSQLKQFEKDILSLGDESSLRASRGEKPVLVPIPKGITIDNDAEDFVLGMPEKPLVAQETAVDEDLSDISGKGGTKNSDSTQESSGPDLSSLLMPVDLPASDDADSQEMPDLSMFSDEPEPQSQQEVEPVVEEEKEISIADMGLDALLAGAGFDGSDISDAFEEVSDFDSIDSVTASDDINNITIPEQTETKTKNESNTNASESFLDDLPPELAFLNDIGKSSETVPSDTASDFSFDTPGDETVDVSNDFLNDFSADSLNSLPSDNFAIDDSVLEPVDNVSENNYDFDNIDPVDNFDSNSDFNNIDSLDSIDDIEVLEDFDSPDSSDNFNPPDFSGDFGIDDIPLPSDDSVSDNDFGDISFEDIGESTDSVSNETSDFSFDNSDLGDFAEISEDMFSSDSKNDTGSFEDISFDDIQEPATTSEDDMFGTEEVPDILEAVDGDIPDYDDIQTEDFGADPLEEGTVEVFDTTGMDDMDFGIPDTDSSFGSGDASGDSDDFSMGSFDFEIPGFSDVAETPEPKAKPVHKTPNLDEPDFSKGLPGTELPPNTLSDEQYKIFIKNFATYPLNVRLAFEDLIVQNEFTDDAEFEVIEKILNKAPARQVASMLEKMLDTSIPVPRDYEHRTAEEYAAYKKSIQYQLRNKIIPGILVTAMLVLVSWGMFNFGKNCIYIPAKASKYYKQGYTLLQADEYAQAQMKFNQAASYKMKKKWFFKYARGYREHKQYYRAAELYQKTLIYFNHDKQAGLEYADMELNDLSNYSNAEEIVRRQLLDYHVNDEDGILMLGDVFLEWGTEKDPSKLENAKEQYLKLLQLYKPNDLYNSRMMRYYIRSDNLQQVLAYQKMFEANEKSLSADDWTELSGYLLEKLYGPMSPSEEPLRYKIEGLRKLLQRAVSLNPDNPTALYNLANYYINTNEIRYVESTLKKSIDKYNSATQLKKRDIYKYIDAYRLQGENYVKLNDYLQAQEQYTNGITLYITEKENAAFEGNEKIGKMYADLADINYLLAGDYDNAAINYKNSVDLGYDNATIRYRLGYMSYKKKNYQEALGSFMKAGENNIKERNLLFAMGNTLALRSDDYAAEGYYEQLISQLDQEVSLAGGSMFPQNNADHHDIVTLYMYAANNFGVILHRLAARTGDSQKNAQSIVQLQQSVRAWDSLTRNQTTMLRLEGSNLAEENIKYVTHPVVDFEPSIYLDIPKTLSDSEQL